MLKFLKGLLGPADEPSAAVAGQAPAITSAREDEFRVWLRRLLGHLPPAERERLASACIEVARQGVTPGEAVLQGLMDQERGHWALMQVDWKASEEVEWQAREIAVAQGLAPTFSWDVAAHPDAGVLDALLAYDAWLRAQHRGFLFLAVDDDAYYGVAVAEAEEAAILDGARALGVRLMRSDEFRRSQGLG